MPRSLASTLACGLISCAARMPCTVPSRVSRRIRSRYRLSCSTPSSKLTSSHDDSRRLEAYVDAAQTAVLGLAQEREQILVEARGSNLTQENRQELRRRIDRYLLTTVLRPQLETAKSWST